MRILVTGGSGYIGSAVASALTRAGHEVVAPVRNQKAADKAQASGASPVIGDLTDQAWLVEQLGQVDAAIHTASPGDDTSRAFDSGVADAVITAFSGTGKRYLHTSGIWIFGSGDSLTEGGAFDPPALTAWRPEIENRLLASDFPVSLPVPAIVYGHGAGIAVAATAARDADGRVLTVGDGTQHWTTVHVDDLAELYRIIVEAPDAPGYVLAVSGQNPTVQEIADAASNGEGFAPESVDDSRERLGEAFADALLLDQQADGARARSLGWTPTRPSLVEELRAAG